MKITKRKRKFKLFMSDAMDDSKIEGYFSRLSNLRSITLSGSKSKEIVNIVNTILKDNSSRILVFSSFVAKGLRPLSTKLKKVTSSFRLYTGITDVQSRERIVSQYRSGEVRGLLLSPVGFEGLDLYGTTHVIIMEPHYNPEKVRQLVSRAIRAFSPVRELRVITLKSISSENLPNIDESVLQIAERKQHLADLMLSVL
jgi:SNF2 family DNA or RNA helicase